MTSIDFSSPLSDDEFACLEKFCDEHLPQGIDRLLGILHAVAVAPSMMPPSAWMGAALPDKSLGAAGDAQEVIGLVLRCYNDVLAVLRDGKTMTPDEDDGEACERFAAGYVDGARLDPQWRGFEDRWTFAAPFAFLCGRRELVPADMLGKTESESSREETLKNLRRQMGAMIVAADESFTRVRRDAMTAMKAAAQVRRPAERVGRNEPCPCGSGKKYKKCCGAA